ncbi:unnamed protein product [Ectocarpus sp. CCAP 1310/34]|nr:unnamed protein product [Ectocarpus sp. CCAP 1310/34]CAB1108379.1 unnamed protein product [Ectocarpus sp. CCAP 1310/34]
MSLSCCHDARRHYYGPHKTQDCESLVMGYILLVDSSPTALLPALRCDPPGILTLPTLRHGSGVALGSTLGCCWCCLGVV